MSVTDKMGGIVTVRLIKVQDILEYHTSYDGTVDITLKQGREFTDVPLRKNGTNLQITNAIGKSGQLFSINLQVELKNTLEYNFSPFNKYIAIVYGPKGVDKLVLGTPDFPLSAKAYPVMSSSASGYNGVVLELDGAQPWPPLRPRHLA